MQPGTKRLTIVAAFAAIYVIWGSTYLAIRIGLESLPPFLLAGARFAVAGCVLYAWLRLRGVPRPTDAQWWSAALTGTLMLVGGVGGVTWAEQFVPSGVAALLVATLPLWMTVIDTSTPGRSRADWRTVLGIGVGLTGVAVLVWPGNGGLASIHPVGAAVIVVGTLSWSIGSLRSRTASLPSSPAMTVAVQMVSAGVVLLVISSALGEWQQGFTLSAVSGRSLAALVYLAVIGSIVALCAYVWLLRQVAAPAVATYAFVNPVVAVLLGWAVAGEAVGPVVLLATALIVGAVVLIQSTQWRQASAPAAARGRVEIPVRTAMPAAVADTPVAAIAEQRCDDGGPRQIFTPPAAACPAGAEPCHPSARVTTAPPPSAGAGECAVEAAAGARFPRGLPAATDRPPLTTAKSP